MTTDVTLKKLRLSVSNAVHSLAVLVAHDEGLFRDQGLDVEELLSRVVYAGLTRRPELPGCRP
jgi:hypothetical protein